MALARALAREPRGAAARRAALRARPAHARRARAASWPRCSATPRCRRCSSPTTSPRRRCSATASGIVDRGRVIQPGTAGELAAAPASAFVADFTGATVLTGEAAPGADGLTRVALDGGGSVASVEPGHGRVAVSVYPWEVALDAPEAAPTGSAQNHVVAEVVSVTAVGNRIRVGMATPQPLVAEITGPVGARARARAGRARRRDVEGRRDARAPALRSGGMAERYGVFLRPDPLTCAAVTRITGQLRAQFGLVSAGAFPPHATLAGSLPLAGPPEELARARPGRAVHGAEPRARLAQRRPRLRRPRPRDGAARRHRRRGRPPAARSPRPGWRRTCSSPAAGTRTSRSAPTTSRRGRTCTTRSRRTSAGWPSRCRRSSPPRSIAVYRLEHETWTGSWWRAMEWEHVRSLRLASR